MEEAFQKGSVGAAGDARELVAANSAVETALQKKGQSMTHGARYMRFLRMGRNKAKVTANCAQRFNGAESERLSLFASWKACDEDFHAVELQEERYRRKEKTHRDIYAFRNEVQLLEMLKDPKLVQLMKEWGLIRVYISLKNV